MLTIKVNLGSFYFMEETPFVQVFNKWEPEQYVSYKSLRQEFFREIKSGEVSVINSAGIVIDKIDL